MKFCSRLFLYCFLAGAAVAPAFTQAPVPETPSTSSTAVAAAKAADDYSAQAFVVERQRTSYRFEADGTSKRVEQLNIRVQSDAGVQQLGQLQLGYNSATQKITIDYVRVRKPDGKTITADASAVQDMTAPVARVAPMYTDYRQKHVTVPALRPGDTLEYQTTIETTTPLAANNFWMDHTFNDALIVLDEQLTVDVPKSRAVKIKTTDDFKNYDTKDEGERRLYTWKFKNLQTRAAREDAEREQSLSKNRKKKKSAEEASSVQLTTFSTWDEMGKWYSALEQPRRVPSDELKAKAVALTKDLKTDREKIQAIYDYVATNFRYVSLSFGVGWYQPHAAAEVFKNGYGDCKDKHTLLGSMLRSIGYDLNTVLIHGEHKLDRDVASPSQFNHVIGNVKLGEETIWMDTTSEVAPIGMLVAQIRDRDALQITPAAATSIAHTPASIPGENFSNFDLKGSVSELGRLEGHVKHTLRGDGELAMRAIMRQVPRDRWTEVMTYVAAQEGLDGKVTNVETSALTDTSKPFTLDFDVSVANFYDWTAKQTKFSLPLDSFKIPTLDEDDTDPARLGGPAKLVARLEVKVPPTVKLAVPVPVSVKRDYAEYASTAKFENQVLTAERRLTLKVPDVKPERAADLKSFARVLAQDSGQQIRAEFTSNAGVTGPKQAKTEELEDAAFKALQANKLKLAAELYDRVTQNDPKHPRAWNNLGRAYLGMMQLDKAIAAFKKQIEVNPYDEFAYNNLGNVYEQQSNYDEAIASYNKQIEINPLDQYAHANLGRLLMRQRKYKEALPEFERATGINPDDAYMLQQLGEAYLRTGQTEKAMETFDKALEKAPNPALWNNVAYTLAEQKQRLDKAQQYAESAVSSTETVLRNLRPEQADTAGLAFSVQLATYWDTLGWVYFQQGNIEKAEKYILASWQNAEHGEVGYHLGQIYERKGQKQKAIQTYAEAAVATQPVPESRERLVALVGENQAKILMNGQRGDMTKRRMVKLDWPKQDGSGEVLYTFAPTGKPQDVKVLSQSEAIDSHRSELKNVQFGLSFPGTTTEGFVRKGLVSCSKIAGCMIVLLPADSSSIGMVAPEGQ